MTAVKTINKVITMYNPMATTLFREAWTMVKGKGTRLDSHTKVHSWFIASVVGKIIFSLHRERQQMKAVTPYGFS